MNDRLDLEIEQFKRGLADLDARMHALEAKAPPQIAADIGAATTIITDLQMRIHVLEAKVTRLQMFSLDRPCAFPLPAKEP
jgi:hypothetical protein